MMSNQKNVSIVFAVLLLILPSLAIADMPAVSLTGDNIFTINNANVPYYYVGDGLKVKTSFSCTTDSVDPAHIYIKITIRDASGGFVNGSTRYYYQPVDQSTTYSNLTLDYTVPNNPSSEYSVELECGTYSVIDGVTYFSSLDSSSHTPWYDAR